MLQASNGETLPGPSERNGRVEGVAAERGAVHGEAALLRLKTDREIAVLCLREDLGRNRRLDEPTVAARLVQRAVARLRGPREDATMVSDEENLDQEAQGSEPSGT